MSRLSARTRGLGALVVLVALLLGVPFALWRFVGWPLPSAIPTWAQLRTGLTAHGIPDEVLFKILACVCWLAWFGLFASVTTEAGAVIRGRAARRLPLLGFVQPLAAHLVTAVVLAVLATSARPQQAGSVPLSVALAGHNRPAAAATGEAAGDGHAAHPPGHLGRVEVAAAGRYVVVRHDTLWGIAARELDDPLRWREIYGLNEGRPQPDGRALSDPNLIYAGWVLRLPASADTHAGSKTVRPPGPRPAPQRHPKPAPTPSGRRDASPRPSVPPSTPGTVSAPAPPAGIDLPSGAYLAGSFAAGVLAAVAAGRLRRRRRYRPAAPEPGRSASPAPLAPALLQLLQATRSDDDTDQTPRVEASSSHGGEPASRFIRPPESHRLEPEVIDAGTRESKTVRLRLTDQPGVVLTGPGAEPAGRAWVAALATAAGPFGVEVLLVGSVANELLPGTPTPPLPALRPVERLSDALNELEVEVIARARRLGDYPDAAAYRTAEPADPLPFLLVVADDVPGDLTGRLRAILAAGQRLSIGALLLGASDAADARIGVEENGQVVETSPQLSHLQGTRLYQLGSDEASELLGPIAFAQSEPPVESAASAPVPSGPHAAGQLSEPIAGDAPIPDPWPLTERLHRSGAPIQVRLLGPYRIEAWGEPVATGLRSGARELLAWYLLHLEGASAEAAIEALWPDVPLDKGPQRFWTALGNLRSRLRGPSGAPRIELLIKSGDHYAVEADVIDADVWRFQSALAEALAAGEDLAAVSSALGEATRIYGGDFAEGADYLWAEPVREDLHRRALDACVRLAELQANEGQLDPAITALERAIEFDPYAEEIYRRLMRLQAQRHRPDALARIWKLLQGRLAELDIEPEDATLKLHRELSRVSSRPSTTVSASVPGQASTAAHPR
jgi:DNA-binding SARP family transcriptional activator